MGIRVEYITRESWSAAPCCRLKNITCATNARAEILIIHAFFFVRILPVSDTF